jgi:hypothetical protein
LTTLAQRSLVPSCMTSSMPSSAHSARATGDFIATIPPEFSRSPCRLSISAWLSMMPVLGECTAATH